MLPTSLERKYFTENSPEVIKAKRIAEEQWEKQMDDALDCDAPGVAVFEHFDITIANPFRDDSGRFAFTLDDAYEYYGTSVMNWFINYVDKYC